MEDDSRIFTRDFSLLLSGWLLQGISFYFLLPVLPMLVTGRLGLGEQEVGLVVGIFSATAVLIRPFSGFLLDRFGRRGFLLGASLLFTAAMFAYALADSLELLVANRLLHGLAWGLVSVTGTTVAADLVPANRRGTGMGWWGMAMPLALSVGPMLGASLLSGTRFGLVFCICGVLAAAAFGCFADVRMPVIHNPRVRLRLRDMIELRVGRLFWLMLVLCVGYGGVVAFGPLYAPQVGFENAGPLFTAWAAGAVLARLPGGKLYDELGPRRPGLVGLGLLVVCWLGLGLWRSATGLIVSAAGLGFGFGLLMPGVQAMTVDLVEPERRGAANATVFSSFDIGIAAGSMGFGLLARTVELPVIFLISAGLAGLALLLFTFWVLPHFEHNRL
ncbi:MAG: MFS transporter [Deltaproteobacteria bacterium]|nr:MFS transporter [Deltaproteobacteria bacterium]